MLDAGREAQIQDRTAPVTLASPAGALPTQTEIQEAALMQTEAHGGPPELIAIDHDDYHAAYVGHLTDGRQFFLTTPFVPLGDEFVTLYLFDRTGQLLEAKIDNFGPRQTLNHEARQRLRDQRLHELGPVTFDRIDVAPFAVERFGIQFGLVAHEPEDGEDHWTVSLEPGDYMAFSAPWDSGDYDT